MHSQQSRMGEPDVLSALAKLAARREALRMEKDVPTATTTETACSNVRRFCVGSPRDREPGIGYDVKGDRQPWLALCVR